MGKTQITAEPGTPFLQITREFDAPKELLFRAHTEPDLLVQWLGPHGVTMAVDRYEIRDGGTWRYTHTDADGNEYGFHGVFHGQPSVDGIVQTFEFEGAPGHVMLEWLTFEERDGKTICAATRSPSRLRTATRWSSPGWRPVSSRATSGWTICSAG